MNITRPHFVVSDLHMGDKGPRDNFAAMSNGRREREFHGFLDMVEKVNGEITIAGDLFELWQGNVSQVIVARMSLLDRLASMGARYMLGNHDIDLKFFIDTVRLTHPLFDVAKLNLTFERVVQAAGKRILIIHGHEQDVYCKSDIPGIGRISAIYSGIREDKNGGPLNHRKYGGATVETRSLGRWGRFSAACRRLVGKPNATAVMRSAVYETYVAKRVDALIYGHTHEPGQFERYSTVLGQYVPLPIYNSGTWAETVNSYVIIHPNGTIQLMDWVEGVPQHNMTRLKVT